MKLAILGSQNSTLGFKAIGFDVFSDLTKINLDDYGILFIAEDWAEKFYKEINEISTRTLPAIITLPTAQGATKESLKNLKKIIEKAVGSDILKLE
ncbi:MAG: V-type ATP synthase subunit F [Candidatus Portnoybacteria bacterium CG23_combo_of_CG06-09_8_20_14_all_37_13]|uniref:V-type ATP synthase subunit F n=1 Tax=Candidatus Portnoybacteria bacterium CG23_combo_of_CG06-09_8_20_14_all_37_13 TaxID=1974819 RepID=A0A2G9YE22_9BACT|nr:MAG: V-type ATP synthase subunit F [Candidatus Portnoybacteria bacterium CG23_combo_of_CG06-09_8_20_14_all_37_13]